MNTRWIHIHIHPNERKHRHIILDNLLAPGRSGDHIADRFTDQRLRIDRILVNDLMTDSSRLHAEQ
ncbi:hypothetical protein [Candidatus Villigracilis saccharophilus]|uniref:hypothetical protein n=1 Tax=Candidatus Villigracilis saccharophilus TaxID=3140684 RepID=UPI003136547B|nr:hypothetical protein [Anaerolineales bacterium]